MFSPLSVLRDDVYSVLEHSPVSLPNLARTLYVGELSALPSPLSAPVTMTFTLFSTRTWTSPGVQGRFAGSGDLLSEEIGYCHDIAIDLESHGEVGIDCLEPVLEALVYASNHVS